MSFVDKLRMNSIFPTGDNNPFGPPAQPQGINLDEISALIGRINPGIQANKDADLNRQKSLMGFQHALNTPGGMNAPMGTPMEQNGGQLNNIANNVAQNKPMNTVYDHRPELAKAGLELKQNALEQKGELGGRALDIKQGDQGIRQQRANIYDYKSKHPDKKFVAQKGGNFFYEDPASGQMVDTGIPSGSVSDAERMKITGEQQTNLQRMKGEQGVNLQNIKGSQVLSNIAANVAGKKDVQQQKFNLTPEKEMLPTQTRVDQNLKARELINSKPELAQFVKIDPANGSFEITPPGTSFFGSPTGPSKEQYDAIQSHIYGTGTPTVPKKSTKPEVKKTTAEVPKSKYAVTIK